MVTGDHGFAQLGFDLLHNTDHPEVRSRDKIRFHHLRSSKIDDRFTDSGR
jgi:hypothetical protein